MQTQGPEHTTLQVTPGTTWEIFDFLDMGAIVANHLLDGPPNLRNTPDPQSHTGLDRRLTHQHTTYGIKDPPERREKASILRIFQSTVTTMATTNNTKTCHTAKLIQLGFYFYLSSCKNTKYIGHFQTVQFCPLLDFIFFVGDRILPADNLIEHFQHATKILLDLDNHNNATIGESVSNFQYDLAAAWPVREGINIFLLMHGHICPGVTPVRDYPDTHQRLLASRYYGTISLVLVQPALDLPQKMSGCTISALAEPWLCIFPGSRIALVFMVYIKQYISPFSMGVSVRMIQQPRFQYL